MRDSTWIRIGLCTLLALVGAGCQTTRWTPTLGAAVAPGPSEAVVLEDLIIVFDGSGSMTLEDKYTTAKRFLRSFVVAMPEGSYGVNAMSFGGEWIIDWPLHPRRTFDRVALADYADDLRPIMGSTFMAEAVDQFNKDVLGSTRKTAVLLISDGKAENPGEALAAIDRLNAAHDGELCVYTVQVGDDEQGGQLLFDMAQRTGCGRGVHVDTASTPEGMEALVREIFFGQKADHGMSGMNGESKTLLFGSGKSYIRPEYNIVLDEVAKMMEVTPAARLRVDGHADTTGGESSNQTLSQQRADAVKRALMERGVAADRVETQAHGESAPAQTEVNPAARQLNRRVEITVLK